MTTKTWKRIEYIAAHSN